MENITWNTHSLTLLVAVSAVFLVAGVVKGVVGLGLPTVAMGLLGLMMAPREAATLLTAGLGAALVAYAALGLAAVRLVVPAHMEAWLSPLAGAATGLVTAATGVFVIPAVPYLQGLGLDKERLVQALGLAFTVSTFALAASLALDSTFQTAVAARSFYALVPALAGMLCGQWIRTRIRPELFRKVFFLGLLALGAHLSLRAMM